MLYRTTVPKKISKIYLETPAINAFLFLCKVKKNSALFFHRTLLYFATQNQDVQIKQTKQQKEIARCSHWKCSIKKVFLKVSQNSLENTCAEISIEVLLGCSKKQIYCIYRLKQSSFSVSLHKKWSFPLRNCPVNFSQLLKNSLMESFIYCAVFFLEEADLLNCHYKKISDDNLC